MSRLEDFVQFSNVASLREDGAKLTAQRIVTNLETPLYWQVILVDKNNQYINTPDIQGAGGKDREKYQTEQLSELARKNGFTTWYPLEKGRVEAMQLIDGEEVPVQLPIYDPDPTKYPLK